MNWTQILTKVSTIIHQRIHENSIYYDKSQIENDWLGYPPCSPEAITRKETELGVKLPQSYKNFLLTSNGFRQLSFWTGQLLPIDEIGFLKDKESLIYKIHEDEEDELDIPDEVYFNYDQQNTAHLKVDHLLNAIVISKNVEGTVLMLNPKVQYAEECEAWVFANWSPGASRYPSFKKLVLQEINSTIHLLNEEPTENISPL